MFTGSPTTCFGSLGSISQDIAPFALFQGAEYIPLFAGDILDLFLIKNEEDLLEEYLQLVGKYKDSVTEYVEDFMIALRFYLFSPFC
jgi:hypothetical protein